MTLVKDNADKGLTKAQLSNDRKQANIAAKTFVSQAATTATQNASKLAATTKTATVAGQQPSSYHFL